MSVVGVLTNGYRCVNGRGAAGTSVLPGRTAAGVADDSRLAGDDQRGVGLEAGSTGYRGLSAGVRTCWFGQRAARSGRFHAWGVEPTLGFEPRTCCSRNTTKRGVLAERPTGATGLKSDDPWDIASSLIVLMLVPLSVGLLIKARYEELADGWVETVGRASSVALLLGIGAALLVTWQDILGAIGSWISVGTAILLAAGLISGYVAGVGRSRGDMTVTALATAQRNIAAAIVVATSLSGDVLVLTLVGALVIPIVLIVLAGELGKAGSGSRPSTGVTIDPEDASG